MEVNRHLTNKQTSYLIMKKVLFILLAFLATVTAIDAQRVVKGRITDKSGDPVIGANVVAKGTNLGTITDLDEIIL
ncbi:MAG: hypothetical protein IPH96_12600 [Saprospiraceae bacterium]|nr:hypothetical protein [Saprospiraceae bacterium]